MSIKRQAGLSLVELVMFIVVVSVGVVGVMSVMGNMVARSADPMARKQALAIAESLLTEIQQQPFTWCDPQDAAVISATSAASCTNDQNKGGVAFSSPPTTSPTPAGELRGDTSNPFDNVADYAGYQAAGNVITGNVSLSDYTASVTISRAGAAGAFASIPLDAVLQIVVTVTGRNETVSLTGYRVRYAPNSPG